MNIKIEKSYSVKCPSCSEYVNMFEGNTIRQFEKYIKTILGWEKKELDGNWYCFKCKESFINRTKDEIIVKLTNQVEQLEKELQQYKPTREFPGDFPFD